MGRFRFPCRAAAVPTLLAALALLSQRAAATESEPRLMLPGHHVVRPGQWVELRWSQADSVTELEILLSRDGGRHYSECISPQLEPRQSRFVWRVPEESGGSLRMRIRFNRRGQEIEGAPTGALIVSAGSDAPEPLGLPPLATGSVPRVPRPAQDRGQEPVGRSEPGLADGAAATARPWSRTASIPPTTPLARTTLLTPFQAPWSRPLRA